MKETVTAWSILVVIVFVVVVSCLFGWPHYKRYTAKLSAQTEIDIAKMKDDASLRVPTATGQKP